MATLAKAAPGSPGAAARSIVESFAPRVRRDERHRYTVQRADGVWRPAPSVTRILQSLDKPALPQWAARSQYEADLEAAWELYSTCKPGFPKWKFEAVFQAEVGELKHEVLLRRANDHGRLVHAAIEAELKGEPVPEGMSPAVCDAFGVWREWWRGAGLTPLCVEAPVAYLTRAGEPFYAGTFDLLALRPDRSLVVVDWKSSKSIGHDEQRLQSVAYRAALRQMGVPGPVSGMLVRIPRCATSKVETYEVQDDLDAAFRCFCALAAVHTWRTR